MSDEPHPGDTIDLSPGKEIYRSAAVDVSYVEAIKELVDNAVDNWARVSRRTDDVTIKIEAEGSRTIVTDDTGGLGPSQISALFALGEQLNEDVPGSIGAYGVGAKKAIVRLGDRATIKSRPDDQDEAVGFSVDDEWLSTDDKWEVTLEAFDDVDQRETVIEIDSRENIWNAAESEERSRIEVLREELAATYAKFIRGETAQGGSITIVLNGEEVDPAGDVDWSFTPLDGLWPRRYENIELDHSDLSEPVRMSVTVGLMREISAEEAGTDIYCQGRLVVRHNRGGVGGYGPTTENRIGKFRQHHNRLRVIVELETTGDAADLPWDGQKSNIDEYHPVTRAAHDWLRRLVRPYFDADTGKVYAGHVKPYTSDNEYAANNSEVQVLDYNGRERVGSAPEHKPADRERIREIERMVADHADDGIRYYGELEDEEIPAYESRLKSKAMEKGRKFDELERKEETEIEETTSAIDPGSEHIDDALADVEGAGKSRRDALYDAGFETRADLKAATKSELMAVENIGEGLAKDILRAVGALDESGVAGGGSTDDVDSDDEAGLVAETSAVSTDEQMKFGSDDDSASSQPGHEPPSPPDAEETTTDGREDLGDAEIESLVRQFVNEDPEHAIDIIAETFANSDEDRVLVPVFVDEDEQAQIRDAAGVSGEATAREFGEMLGKRLVAIYGSTPQPTDD
jgi:hypothetical protein